MCSFACFFSLAACGSPSASTVLPEQSPTAAAVAGHASAQSGRSGQQAPAGLAGMHAGSAGMPLAAAGASAGRPALADAGARDPGDDAGMTVDAGGIAQDAGALQSQPGKFKLFDKIPQFGMYATSDPKGYTPPTGVRLWKRGTEFVTKLSAAQQAQIGSDLTALVTYHAQCDNYDRIGGVFAVIVPRGQAPKESDPRLELVRFITPFSDYKRGALATYMFPAADIAAHARTLADAGSDVWIGIGGGSNPYDGDPCTNDSKSDDFKAIGFSYSLELASTQPLTAAMHTTLVAAYNLQAMQIPVTGKLDNPGQDRMGKVTVIVSGHGAESGGDEYQNTTDTLSLNGQQIGMFKTAIDCAQYAKFSPDGNQGIFNGNNAGNPRNWCPGALVPPHTFPALLKSGMNEISLGISPNRLPSGSYYATSISFSAP